MPALRHQVLLHPQRRTFLLSYQRPDLLQGFCQCSLSRYFYPFPVLDASLVAEIPESQHFKNVPSLLFRDSGPA